MEPAGFSLREPERTPPTEVSSGVRSVMGVLMLVLSLLAGAYLLYAMLRPERF
jgi:K+-transporting ATPase KdpF subunit